ncbi:NAD-dependent epimerase/dehydratase family protein [Cochleicola gelatinilyticus]|uniref:NAD-dependent epimerase n=1 Tax=Cochleicola gelatinilyticus TaxID=1763537 RepID=A0A167ISG6_9FLAO|nr:NAD-dependent epimerase/dehydratase family protein [Cochleicola gelatinilyticus]OAB79969.1 NAD-dependent epimerase [Cochleicola gelatinilyticus]
MVLVTGGTGLVGSHLLYFLLKEHQNVRATHRSTSDINAVKKIFSYYGKESNALFERINWVEADIIDIPALTEAFKGITHVYHAAAYISFDPKHYHKLKKANVEGTANVVNLCLSNSIEKLCYVSSVATLGSTLDNTLITEETHWNPAGENSVYAITKYDAEMEVWRGMQEGLNAVIVNPGIIFGEGFWNSGSGVILKMIAKELPFYTSGGMGFVDVRDVVSVLIQLMNSTIAEERFILVGENLHYKELLSEIATLQNKKIPKKRIAQWKLMLFCNLDWAWSALFGGKRKLLKATVRSMYTVSFYDATKVKETLAFSFTPYQQTLQRVNKAFLEK